MTHTSTEQPEALPCPFCGGHSTLDSNGQDFRVFCWDCGAKSKEFDCWQKAEAAWNRRTPAAQAQRAPLSDAEALKLLKSGPVYAPNGEVNRRPLEYRREIENARLRGFRIAERTYGITQEKQG